MQEYYLPIKTLHVTLAILSLCGFAVRAAWSIAGSEKLKLRWVRIIPHVVDTFLLTTAIILMLILNQHPGNQSWIAAKLVALLFYIGFGTMAVKRATTVTHKSIFFVLALTTFIYIAGVALAHHPASWLHGI